MFPGFDYTTPKKPKVRQLNFLVEADGEVVLSPEHDQFQWADEPSLADLKMSAEMRQCFKQAFAATKIT